MSGQQCGLVQRHQKLTHLNDALLSQLDLPKLESFWFTATDKTKSRRLPHPSPRLRPRQKIPRQIPDPRRPGRRLGRHLELPLERRALCRQRLRGRHDQSSRLDRLRPGHRRRRQRRLGRQALHRPDDRPRLRRAALSLHRQDPRVRARRQLRRIHGQLGPRPHQPLQMHRHPRRHVRPRVSLRDDRRVMVQRVGVQRPVPGTTTANPTPKIPTANGLR